jgi:hypothetical protein
MTRRSVPALPRLLLAALLPIAACASPPPPPRTPPQTPPPSSTADDLADESVALYVARHARLLAVSYAIRSANVDICGDQVGPILGIAAWRHKRDWTLPFGAAFERTFDAPPGAIAVVAVHPGSPADRAGVLVGDQLVSAEGAPVYTDVELFTRIRPMRQAVRIEVRRADQILELSIEPELACYHEGLIEVADWMLTDGTSYGNFYVTSGFVRFTRDDDELALVVAHEMAHRLGGLDAVPGPGVEIRADLIGLHLADRAGFDVTAAPGFWDRVALEQPWTLSDDVEHYGFRRVPPHAYMPSRAAAIRRIVDALHEDPELAAEWLADAQR